MDVYDNKKREDDRSLIQFVRQITAVAAMECFGVVGLSYRHSPAGFIDSFTQDALGKGVKVIMQKDGRLEIQLHVIIDFGVRIVAVAESLIDSVKFNVEKQTGLKVSKVDIFVQYVRV